MVAFCFKKSIGFIDSITMYFTWFSYPFYAEPLTEVVPVGPNKSLCNNSSVLVLEMITMFLL